MKFRNCINLNLKSEALGDRFPLLPRTGSRISAKLELNSGTKNLCGLVRTFRLRSHTGRSIGLNFYEALKVFKYEVNEIRNILVVAKQKFRQSL